MPEPGITDRYFNRPTTDREEPRRKSRPRLKISGEYAEFRLEDGRYLGEVMGRTSSGPRAAGQRKNSAKNCARATTRSPEWSATTRIVSRRDRKRNVGRLVAGIG
jgi:hypothetical protein